MLTCCAADTVTEQNLNRSVAFAQPCGVTSVLLSPAYLILLLCMAAGRCHSSVRADGAGGTNMICCSMTLQSERKRERRERERPSELWSLLILSICLPVLMLQVKLTACTGDPRLRGSRPCWLVFTPRETVLCWFWCTCAVLWLRASSGTPLQQDPHAAAWRLLIDLSGTLW